MLMGLTNICTGLMLMAVCAPLAKRKVKMNRWYGMRLPKAFTSDENWYKINEYGGKLFMGWSIPIVLGGVVLFFLPDIGLGALYVVPVFSIILLVPLIKLLIYASKI
jgi:hypothetical protein